MPNSYEHESNAGMSAGGSLVQSDVIKRLF